MLDSVERNARSSAAHLAEAVKQGFVMGLVLIAPLAVTAFVIQFVYGWLVGAIRPMLRVVPGLTVPFAEPVAILVLFVLITVGGLVFLRGFGTSAVTRFDRFMEGVPGVSPIYKSVRQATTALSGDEHNFERVGLVRFPGSDLHVVGFVTAETPETIHRNMAPDAEDGAYYNVFVPMAPNPMGGFLVVVPEDRLVITDLTVSEGVQLIMTTGMSGEGQYTMDGYVTD